MVSTRSALVLFFSLSISLSVNAWDMKDFTEEISSPVTHTPNELMVGAGLALSALAVRNPYGQNFETKEHLKNGLGENSKYGDYAGQLIPNAAYAIFQGVGGYHGDPDGYRRAVGMFKATAYAGAVTSVLKYTVRAPRPNDNSIKNSFPSGHSATIFAFSGYVAAEHGWGWGSAAMALGAYCGYSRIHDKMHRLHEVFAGATLGLTYGMAISRLQKEKNQKDGANSNGFSFAPIMDSQTKGIALYKEF